MASKYIGKEAGRVTARQRIRMSAVRLASAGTQQATRQLCGLWIILKPIFTARVAAPKLQQGLWSLRAEIRRGKRHREKLTCPLWLDGLVQIRIVFEDGAP